MWAKSLRYTSIMLLNCLINICAYNCSSSFRTEHYPFWCQITSQYLRENIFSGLHCTVVWKCIKRDYFQKFPCNQLFSNLTSKTHKNVDLTGKKCGFFFVKTILVFYDFSLIQSHWKCKIFRQVKYLVNPLFSRNFCP